MNSSNKIINSLPSWELNKISNQVKPQKTIEIENNANLSNVLSEFKEIKSMHLGIQHEINKAKLSFRKVFEDTNNPHTNLIPNRATSEISQMFSRLNDFNQQVLKKDSQYEKRLFETVENIKKLLFDQSRDFDFNINFLVKENLKLKQSLQLQQETLNLSLEGSLFNYLNQKVEFLQKIVDKKENVIAQLKEKQLQSQKAQRK